MVVKTAAAGAFEAERLSIVIQKIRQLEDTEHGEQTDSRRSAVLSLESSALHPDFRIL